MLAAFGCTKKNSASGASERPPPAAKTEVSLTPTTATVRGLSVRSSADRPPSDPAAAPRSVRPCVIVVLQRGGRFPPGGRSGFRYFDNRRPLERNLATT